VRSEMTSLPISDAATPFRNIRQAIAMQGCGTRGPSLMLQVCAWCSERAPEAGLYAAAPPVRVTRVDLRSQPGCVGRLHRIKSHSSLSQLLRLYLYAYGRATLRRRPVSCLQAARPLQQYQPNFSIVVPSQAPP
jgi:hypothetical protein